MARSREVGKRVMGASPSHCGMGTHLQNMIGKGGQTQDACAGEKMSSKPVWGNNNNNMKESSQYLLNKSIYLSCMCLCGCASMTLVYFL